MSAWDILVRLSCLPELADARYGFHKSRPGGCQLKCPAGSAWPMSKHINCCTAVAQLLLLAAYFLGRDVWMTTEHWMTAMCRSVGDPGAPKMAVDLGLAESYQEGFPDDLVEGDWLVCQGWRGNSGHSFLLRVVPIGETDVAELGVMFLEAAGRARGGATSHGIDGIGSRTCNVANARNWGGGWWPTGSECPMSLVEADRIYAMLYVARLD